MKNLFLTFDDGPDEHGTAATLDVLARHGATATFFVIASEARRRPDLLKRIADAGHAVGNHSLDHKWRAFFASRRHMLAWVGESERILADLLGHPTVGFRSPAGVHTPPLAWALSELDLPLIHWDVRFYDAVWPWRAERALKSLEATAPGSVVLLHDRQRPKNLAKYLETLALYVPAAQTEGFALTRLPPRQGAGGQPSRLHK